MQTLTVGKDHLPQGSAERNTARAGTQSKADKQGAKVCVFPQLNSPNLSAETPSRVETPYLTPAIMQPLLKTQGPTAWLSSRAGSAQISASSPLGLSPPASTAKPSEPPNPQGKLGKMEQLLGKTRKHTRIMAKINQETHQDHGKSKLLFTSLWTDDMFANFWYVCIRTHKH